MTGTSRGNEIHTRLRSLKAHDEVLPGVLFGRPEWVLSPSYWAALVGRQAPCPTLFSRPSSLVEEVGFCLLGGFGIKAEINCAAHARLRKYGVYSRVPTQEEIEKLLQIPLDVLGKAMRYRFPRQRSARLANAILRISRDDVPLDDPAALRAYLLTLDGIGPKTASWITRNWLDSDDVAIIDIHVERAGRAMGLFDERHSLPRDYFEMEKQFLALAESLRVRASELDIAIWSVMRKVAINGRQKSDIGDRSDGKRRRRRELRNNFQEAEAV